MKASVTVRGTGVASAQPDEVRMVLELAAQRAKPEDALGEVAKRSESLNEIFDGLGIPSARRTTSGASVSDVWEYDKQGNRSHAGYRATNSVVIRLEDASLLGKLMNQATEKASARIMGPWWHIAPDNPSRAMACEQAASVARLKAEAYAASLGVRLGGVLRVSEPLDNVPYYGRGAVNSLSLASASAEAEVPVDAGELEVSATVEVKFRLEQD
ncbi:MAG: SIMPL domain-containing protein [Actinomycetota bacterium]